MRAFPIIRTDELALYHKIFFGFGKGLFALGFVFFFLVFCFSVLDVAFLKNHETTWLDVMIIAAASMVCIGGVYFIKSIEFLINSDIQQ